MFEPEERAELAPKMARMGPKSPFVFVDIGANVGLFSLFVAARAGERARILAIEPEPGNFARLAFNVAANPGAPIKPLNLALADEAGELAIELNRRDRGGTRARKLDATQAGAGRCARALPAAAVRAARARHRAHRRAQDRRRGHGGHRPDAVLPRRAAIAVAEPDRDRGCAELWSADLFAALAANGYTVSSRSKLNVMLRRTAQSASGTGAATESPSVVTAQR